jgi:hypothetical protein
MATPAPADFKQYQGRKQMSDDTQAVEDYKLNYQYHRLLRKYCGPNAYIIFTALIDRANDQEFNGWAFPSYELLMEDTGIGNRNAITTALEFLFDLGLIEWQLNGRHAIYKPVKKVNSTELILFQERAEQYQNDTKDSIKTVRSIVSKRYSNVYQSNVNQINELTTPKGVAAPASQTYEFSDYKLSEPEEQLPDALLPDTLEATTQPGPATDKDRAGVKASSNGVHIPSSPQLDLGQEVKGFEAGGGERDMTHVGKARDKPRPKPKAKEPDPNSSHPACLIWQETHNQKLPNKFQMIDIVAQVGDDPVRLDEWRECLIYYARHPHWNQIDSDRILHCYKNENYKKGEVYGQGGNGKQGFGKDRVGTAQQGTGSYGRVLAKSAAFGRDGRLTDEQLKNAW